MASAASIALQLQQLSNQATERSFEYNTQEANTARAWQKEMSDTAHQREVEDLKKAGLNPVLASNNGAQSYTTSSASAQAENAAGPVANVWSSDISAKATRAAAAAQAAATRYAAAQNASAMRYAAAMQYQTQADSWKWKTDYMKAEYGQKTDYMKKEYSEKLKQPVSNFAGLIDKYAQRSGLSDKLVSNSSVKTVIGAFDKFVKNPAGTFIDLGKRFSSNAYTGLNQKAQDKVNYALNRLNIKANKTTRNLFTQAIFNGNTASWDKLIKYMPKKSNVANSLLVGSYGVPISARSGLR